MSDAPSSDRQSRTDFARLYDEHFSEVFRYVLMRVGNVAEAEDLTSQTFFKALRAFWRLHWSGRSVSAWLLRIATNEVNSHFRRRRSRGRWEVAVQPATDAVAQERETVEQRLQRDEAHRLLGEALRGLDPDEQALVVLRYFEHKPFSEIAQICGGRQGTLAMRTHRALKKLRTALEQRGVHHAGFREIPERQASRGVADDGIPARTAS